MNVEKGEIRITRCCRSVFLLRKNNQDYCAECKKPNPEMLQPWFDESGDMMFELISDVRK